MGTKDGLADGSFACGLLVSPLARHLGKATTTTFLRILIQAAVDHGQRCEDFVAENCNITLVCGDSMEKQLDLMAQKKVDGLVGQLPYEMGLLSIQKLYDIVVEG